MLYITIYFYGLDIAFFFNVCLNTTCVYKIKNEISELQESINCEKMKYIHIYKSLMNIVKLNIHQTFQNLS